MGNFKNLPATTQPHLFVARPSNFGSPAYLAPHNQKFTVKNSRRVPCTSPAYPAPHNQNFSQLTPSTLHLAYPAPCVPCTLRTLHLAYHAPCIPCTLHTLHLAYPACVPCTLRTLLAYPAPCVPCTSPAYPIPYN
jgi:hypothetical protein